MAKDGVPRSQKFLGELGLIWVFLGEFRSAALQACQVRLYFISTYLYFDHYVDNNFFK